MELRLQRATAYQGIKGCIVYGDGEVSVEAANKHCAQALDRMNILMACYLRWTCHWVPCSFSAFSCIKACICIVQVSYAGAPGRWFMVQISDLNITRSEPIGCGKAGAKSTLAEGSGIG